MSDEVTVTDADRNFALIERAIGMTLGFADRVSVRDYLSATADLQAQLAIAREGLEAIEKRCSDFARINNITDKQAGTLRNCMADARHTLAKLNGDTP